MSAAGSRSPPRRSCGQGGALERRGGAVNVIAAALAPLKGAVPTAPRPTRPATPHPRGRVVTKRPPGGPQESARYRSCAPSRPRDTASDDEVVNSTSMSRPRGRSHASPPQGFRCAGHRRSRRPVGKTGAATPAEKGEAGVDQVDASKSGVVGQAGRRGLTSARARRRPSRGNRSPQADPLPRRGRTSRQDAGK